MHDHHRPPTAALSATPDTSDSALDLIGRGYRLLAPWYDVVFGISLQHGRRKLIDAMDCRPGDRVLEVCIGTGLSLPLYPRGVQVIGIDFSRDMLEKLRTRVERKGLKNLEAMYQMDAEHLAFPDASFDKVAIMYAIAGIPDPQRAMREIQRVCRPGGTIGIASHFESRSLVLRTCSALLKPIYSLIRYQPDGLLEDFVRDNDLDVRTTMSANLFGYTTLLVCTNRRPMRGGIY